LDYQEFPTSIYHKRVNLKNLLHIDFSLTFPGYIRLLQNHHQSTRCGSADEIGLLIAAGYLGWEAVCFKISGFWQ